MVDRLPEERRTEQVSKSTPISSSTITTQFENLEGLIDALNRDVAELSERLQPILVSSELEVAEKSPGEIDHPVSSLQAELERLRFRLAAIRHRVLDLTSRVDFS